MDPDEALVNCRVLSQKLVMDGTDGLRSNFTVEQQAEMGQELAEQFLALDEWCSINHGFKPRPWK